MRRAEIDALLQEAIVLAQSGQRTEARRQLERVIEADPTRALAWMWLATVSEEQEARIDFLERALTLDPAIEAAQQAYAQLTGQQFTPPESPHVPKYTGPTRSAAVVLAGVVLVGAMVVFLLVMTLDEGDDTSPHAGPLSSATLDYWLTPPSARTSFPASTPSITRTPSPTNSPGPPPTSVWDNAPPTWTPAPTLTASLTWTPAPSSTPHPSPIPYVAPAVKSATAAFALTSDAPPDARMSATAQFEQTSTATSVAMITSKATSTATGRVWGRPAIQAEQTHAVATIEALMDCEN